MEKNHVLNQSLYHSPSLFDALGTSNINRQRMLGIHQQTLLPSPFLQAQNILNHCQCVTRLTVLYIMKRDTKRKILILNFTQPISTCMHLANSILVN